MRLEIWDGTKRRLSIPLSYVPDTNATIRECYETDTEIIVLGEPITEDEKHNCDHMGCSSLTHVLYRFKKLI